MQATPATISPEAAKILKELFVLTLESNCGLSADFNSNKFLVSIYGMRETPVRIFPSAFYAGDEFQIERLEDLAGHVRDFTASRQ